jgi:hypothetical protein
VEEQRGSVIGRIRHGIDRRLEEWRRQDQARNAEAEADRDKLWAEAKERQKLLAKPHRRGGSAARLPRRGHRAAPLRCALRGGVRSARSLGSRETPPREGRARRREHRRGTQGFVVGLRGVGVKD